MIALSSKKPKMPKQPKRPREAPVTGRTRGLFGKKETNHRIPDPPTANSAKGTSQKRGMQTNGDPQTSIESKAANQIWRDGNGENREKEGAPAEDAEAGDILIGF